MNDLKHLQREAERLRAELALFEPTGNFIEGALTPRRRETDAPQ